MASTLDSPRPAIARSRSAHRGLLSALFAIYLAVLVWAVLWKLETPWVGTGPLRDIKLIPFGAGSGFGASAPLEVMGNVAFFIPFGFYLALLIPRTSWLIAACVLAGSSAALEALQFLLAVGSTDITDVIANTAGGLVGLTIGALVRADRSARRLRVITGIGAVATVLMLIGAAVFVASPLHLTVPDHGPLVHRTG